MPALDVREISGHHHRRTELVRVTGMKDVLDLILQVRVVPACARRWSAAD
jgi:hypothetical protein